MSDPVTNNEIEDVLSSIRRLVSEEGAGLHKRARASGASPDRYVLTPALRIADDESPGDVAPAPDHKASSRPDDRDGLGRDADHGGQAEDGVVADGEPDSGLPDGGIGNAEKAGEPAATEFVRNMSREGGDDQAPTAGTNSEGDESSGTATMDHDSSGGLSAQDDPLGLVGRSDRPGTVDLDKEPEKEDAFWADDVDDGPVSDGAQNTRDADPAAETGEILHAPDNGSQHPAEMSLKERVAELEAALEQAPDEWEPDGSEPDGSRDASTPLTFIRSTTPDAPEIRQAKSDSTADLGKPVLLDPTESEGRDSDPEPMLGDALAGDDEEPGRMESAFTGSPDEPGTLTADDHPTGKADRAQETGHAEPLSWTAPFPDGAPGEITEDDAGSAADSEDGDFDLYADDSVIDEEALRELVSDIVRQELQGVLGERITRNVRRLVRREIQRAMTVRELE